ncbi:galactose-specific lectin nattectin-like [Synchiropus splendidus]|uniref:galactose-specific lectin nattectin-like n=1 Tax=Synchiropus splendidus TaxID=270530 RepID=UPI00237D4F50|nr:galactose-specific lectin nattectin-like [Synchiropus splendidus]
MQLENRCFLYRAEKKQWADSELECVKDGGNLLSLHSQKEYEFIRNAIKTITGSDTRVWTGGYDIVKEAEWMWTDGSKWDFTAWGPGEPTNGQKVEHCMELNYFGKANDAGCHNLKPFICSKNSF